MGDAILGIREALHDVNFETYRSSWVLQRSIERGLEIISEASRSIPDELKNLAPDVSWPAIAAIGNILRHEYQRVEPLIIWNIVENHLTVLEDAILVMSREVSNGHA
ncbi:HepT-like ribonuclease domain-containing protein [Asticcacaulis endophyticus]|nr:HepT-like ribonuclease domain-containing protein [Asticcacaulis endophyticus]